MPRNNRKNKLNQITKTKPLPPPPAKSKEENLNQTGIFGTMLQGFSFGAGSSIAHNIFGNLFSSSITPQTKDNEPNKALLEKYQQCLLEKGEWNVSECAELKKDLEMVLN